MYCVSQIQLDNRTISNIVPPNGKRETEDGDLQTLKAYNSPCEIDSNGSSSAVSAYVLEVQLSSRTPLWSNWNEPEVDNSRWGHPNSKYSITLLVKKNNSILNFKCCTFVPRSSDPSDGTSYIIYDQIRKTRSGESKMVKHLLRIAKRSCAINSNDISSDIPMSPESSL